MPAHRCGRGVACRAALYALACALVRSAPLPCAVHNPCEYFQYCSSGTCRACVPGTYGGRQHCAQFNATLPWNSCNGDKFCERLLRDKDERCNQHIDETLSALDAYYGLLTPDESMLLYGIKLCTNGSNGHKNDRGEHVQNIAEKHGKKFFLAQRHNCSQNEWPSRVGTCEPCTANRTASDASTDRTVFCDACPRGWRWNASAVTCTICETCYTTNGLLTNANVTRDEWCRPCSTAADDYRAGSCSVHYLQDCVKHVPMQDVHDVMQLEVYNQREGTPETFAVNDKYFKLQRSGFTLNKRIQFFDEYMYQHKAITTYGLFRPQAYELMATSTQELWRKGLSEYNGYVYTVGPMYYIDAEEAWSDIQEQAVYRCKKCNCEPRPELFGAYPVRMHHVASADAEHYDIVRAAYAALLQHVIFKEVTCSSSESEQDVLKRCTPTRLGLTHSSQTDEFSCSVDNVDDNFCEKFRMDHKEVCLQISERHQNYELWSTLGLKLWNATSILDQIYRNLSTWDTPSTAAVDAPTTRTQLECNREEVQITVSVRRKHAGEPLTLDWVHVLFENSTSLEEPYNDTVPDTGILLRRLNFTATTNENVRVFVGTTPRSNANVTIQNEIATETQYTHKDLGVRVCDIAGADCDCSQDSAIHTPQDYNDIFEHLHENLCSL